MMAVKTVEQAMANKSEQELIAQAMANREAMAKREAKRAGFKPALPEENAEARLRVAFERSESHRITRVPAYDVCDKHGKWLSYNPETDSSMPYCPQCAKEERTKAAFNGVDGIAKRFKMKTFSNYQVTNQAQHDNLAFLAQYAATFSEQLENGTSLMLLGKPGTGKTHLACAIANAVARKGHSVVVRSVSGMFRSIAETWRNGGESKILNAYAEADLLVLDEAGASNMSNAENVALFEVINRRYEEMKPTIIVSNLSDNELEKKIGERVIDRMAEGVILTFDWSSYRRG